MFGLDCVLESGMSFSNFSDRGLDVFFVFWLVFLLLEILYALPLFLSHLFKLGKGVLFVVLLLELGFSFNLLLKLKLF